MIERMLEVASNLGGNGPETGNISPNSVQNPPSMSYIDLGSYIAIIIGIANICLLLALISLYLQNYKRIKSKFTMGLLVFASLLLLQNVVTTLFLALNAFFNVTSQGLDIGTPQLPLSSVNIIQLIALSILLKITWE